MEICLSGAGDEVCAVVHESRALPVHVLYAGICAAGAALGVGQGRLHDAAEIDPGVQEALTMSAGLAAEYAIGRSDIPYPSNLQRETSALNNCINANRSEGSV